MKDLLVKLKLDKHHKIERFGVLFFVLFLIFVVDVASILIRKSRNDSALLDGQVIYTTQFKSSVTNNAGSVVDIFRSNDGTKVFLLLKFDSPTKISTNAENYQMFLTGSSPTLKQTDLSSSPSACIYMFGSTGYMGIYMVNAHGFDKQILDLVVRMNTQLVSDSGSTSTEAATDASFAKYDQFRIYFNPGGSVYHTADFLEEGTMDAFSIYESTVSRTQENEIRAQLDEDLKTMQTNLVAIDEYANRLVLAGMQVPDAPALILDDAVTKDENGNLQLESALTCSKGFDFDWRSGSVRGGYLAGMMPDGISYTQYFSMKDQEVDSLPFNTSKLKLRYSDGSEFTGGSGSDISVTAQIQNDWTLLTSAWTDYYNSKRNYQCTDLRKLLLLEVNARDVDQHYTVNDALDVLTVY